LSPFEFLTRLMTYLPIEPKRRTYKLEVAAEDIELLTIKDFIQRICDAAGCTSKETSNIKLAVDEACSNIIRHAYQGRKDGKISLEAGVGPWDLKFKIVDYGKSFNFKDVKDPDLDHYVDIGRKGGLGIWLIKKVMTKVTYHSFPDRNELILYRKLARATPREQGLAKPGLSISVKFLAGSTALVLVLFLMAYVFLGRRQEAVALKQQRERVGMMIQSMAAQAGRSVARKNDLELDRLIREVRREDKSNVLSYVFVVGQEGRYLAHSDLTQLFASYQAPKGVMVQRGPGVQEFRLSGSEGALTDFASSIFFKGEWVGEMHVGISDRALQRFLGDLKGDYRRMMVVSFLVLILGLYFLSRIVIRPFQRILDGVSAFSRGNLEGRIEVTSQDEFGQLAAIFNDMTVRIQESQKGMVEQERLEKEMQVAQEIQHTLLPSEFPQIEGYEIGAAYRSAKEVGGDYYDFFWVDPTTLGIVVADVSGKGVPGSMVMTMIRTAMRLEARGNKSASDVLSKVNTHVTGDMKKGMFVTMFYIILDSRNRSINFASAGHNPMILYRGKTKEVYFLKPKGFPVGIDLPEVDMFQKNLALQKISLEKDDMLVAYTDGITEAMDPDKQQFGENRLIQVVKENAHLTPAEFVEKLNEAINAFTRGAEQSDDITLVAIKEKMKAETAVFKFRKKLIDLVEKKGLSVTEACRQMNVSTKVYYHCKKLFNEGGKAGLKPVKSKKRSAIRELSNPQKEAVLAVVRKNPEFGPKRIVEAVRKSTDPPMVVDQGVLYEFLKRRRLGDEAGRRSYVLNEVDTP